MSKEDNYQIECSKLRPLLWKLSKEHRKNVMHEKRRKVEGNGKSRIGTMV